MNLSKMIDGSLLVIPRICQNWCMDFSKLLHEFVKVATWIC